MSSLLDQQVSAAAFFASKEAGYTIGLAARAIHARMGE
jgi:hypothetical protein